MVFLLGIAPPNELERKLTVYFIRICIFHSKIGWIDRKIRLKKKIQDTDKMADTCQRRKSVINKREI